jgi:glycosyltransferase involved in cell wall biosynthesis
MIQRSETDVIAKIVMDSMPDITVIILTFNEARHIVRAIESVREIAREIIVVDSFSTDDTAALAIQAGGRVIENPFVNQARQFAWALSHGDIRTGWILRLDADEVIEPDLAMEIARAVPNMPADIAGVEFNRKHIFMGRWIRHGGRYPLRLLRLWRTGQGRVEDRWMDEHVVVKGGRTVALKGGFADVNLHDLGFFTAKHNSYATREAIEILNQRHRLFTREGDEVRYAGTKQASLKRWIKERVYNQLPFWMGPVSYFLWRYFGQLGFLDHRPGLIYHFLQGGWYRFLVNAKVVELELAIANCPDRNSRLARLSALTGYSLD